MVWGLSNGRGLPNLKVSCMLFIIRWLDFFVVVKKIVVEMGFG